jgi:glycosyltransferase involved in cell wall biosynthesis
MRLLHVVHYPVFGGPHNQALRLAGPLRARGWETIALLPDEPGNAAARLREGGVPVEVLPMHRLRAAPDPRIQLRFAATLPREVRAISGLIRDLDIDLVVVAGLVNPHAALAARRADVPLVWQLVDSRAPAPLRKALMPLVLRLSDAVMTTGREIAWQHHGVERIGDRWVSFWPPVDAAEFRPDEKRRDAARSELGIAADSFVIGTVGNLNRQKGHALLLEAASIAVGDQDGAQVVILGAETPTQPGARQALLSHAGSLGLGARVTIVDPGSRVAELLPAFDVFAMTPAPRSEGVPTVILEAMSSGLPVVATPAGGIVEVVEDGVTGFYIKRAAPAIAAALRRLSREPERRQLMGARARAIALERYGLEPCTDAHVRAFEAALSHHRTATDH